MAGKQALDGIKVVDFSWSVVGPLATRHLADHGAAVIRVESHTRPGINRVSGPYKDDISSVDHTSLFSWFNTSKYGMSLNLNKAKSREVARRLVMWTDVLVESFTPGTMEKFGLDYESVKQEKPDIVYASTSCYGQDGPIARKPGFGQTATALSGITNMIGWPDQPTMANAMPHTDFINPPFLVTAIMAALDYRRKTGKGLYLDQSQTESGVHFFAPPVMDYKVNGRIMERDGNHYPHAAPHNVYPCRGDDRWCAIAVFDDEAWEGFRAAAGNPKWTEEARFATLSKRKENEEELDRLVSAWTKNFSPEDVVNRLQERGVAAGVVQTMEELYADPQLAHLGFWRYLDHPVVGVHAHTGPPYRLSKTPDRQFTSPCLGQHNEYIYRELLGFSDDEISGMLIEGVITTDADIPE